MKFHLKKGRKRLCLQQERRECYSWSIRGSECPALSAPQYSPPRRWLRRTQYAAQASQSCLQTSVLYLPPGCARRALEGRHARPRPGQMRRAPVRPPARSSRTGPRRNPGPAKGFPAGRGLVAPRTPSISRETHGERAEAPELRGAHGGRSSRTLRPSGPITGPRTPGRRKQPSPRPRRATLTASPWPGGRHSAESLLLSRAPPRSLALLRALWSQRPGLRPSVPPAASATRVRGSAAESGRGRSLRRDDRGAAGGPAR